MFGKQKPNYFFEQFGLVISYSLRAMEELKKGILNFPDTSSLDLKNSVHAIEHEADDIKHETEERLAKEFMTPIDREDIFLLLDAIDDLTDSIDEISYKIYVRNYTDLPEKTGLFVDVAYQCVVAVNEVVKNLGNLTNKKIMDPLIEKVRNIEEQTDHLYEQNVHALYLRNGDSNSHATVVGEDVYGMFEYVTDKCRDITKQIEIIMYKNL
jgi:predicted phosphate transport protein (TIGR00153 family)